MLSNPEETLAEFHTKLQKLVPDHMHGGIERYIMKGIEPGGFLTALLTRQDWITVLELADDTNRELLHGWAIFFYNYCPSAAWGSRERMHDWMTNRDGIRTYVLKERFGVES